MCYRIGVMPTLVKQSDKSQISDRENEKFMQLALVEGRKGLGLTTPNPPVGAVIVNEHGRVIGRGWHQKAGGPHAEIIAIEKAAETHGRAALKGSSLYVTLEPCSTQGKTPPCCDAIVEAGIKKVFFGTTDPNPDNSDGAVPILKKKGIEVASGICEDDAIYLIRFFKRHIETGRPYVIAKTAMTLDGHTTLPPGKGQWISSLESRDDVQYLRRQCDAILVGGETVRADNPMLTLRGKYAEGRDQPQRVVLTAVKGLPEDAKLFNDEHADNTQIYHGLSFDKVLDDLGKRGITSVLLESGGRLFSHGIGLKMIDEVVFYMAPIIGGGDNKLMPVNGLIAELEDLTVDRIGPDVRITGRIVK